MKTSCSPSLKERSAVVAHADAHHRCQHPRSSCTGETSTRAVGTYVPQSVRFYSPEQCFVDAEKYLPGSLQKRGKATDELAATLAYLRTLVVSLDEENFAAYREEALQRLRGRDAEDWPILAAALSLGCGVWTEDQDFFGTGKAVWMTDRVEIYLRAEAMRLRS